MAAKRRAAGGGTSAYDTSKGRELRLLSRAISRVPMASALDNEVRQGRVWDGNTGLYVRRHGRGGTVTVAEVLAAIDAIEARET